MNLYEALFNGQIKVGDWIKFGWSNIGKIQTTDSGVVLSIIKKPQQINIVYINADARRDFFNIFEDDNFPNLIHHFAGSSVNTAEESNETI